MIRFFLLILVSTLLLIILYAVQTSNSNYSYLTDGKLSIENEFVPSNSTECKPILDNATQYFAIIDGIKYPRSVQLMRNTSINFDCLNKSKTIKKIFLWNSFHKHESYTLGLGVRTPFINKKCPVTSCELLKDRSRLNESDYVIYHMRSGSDVPPKYRPPKQRWIFFLIESPIHSADFDNFNGFFNHTSTYRIDSDFSGYYEYQSGMEWKENKSIDENFDYHKDKASFAVALITNCGAPSRRLEYINEMQKYIQVNIFGACGHQKCPTHFKNGKMGDCKEILSAEYKFYLAYENSVCKEYITEKFFHILRYNIIPVVLGLGPYDYFIPKSGYINALDFASPKELAEYLIYLDKNVTAYNSYFKWKKHVSFGEGMTFSFFCSMCIQLQLENYFGVKKKVIDDISIFWSKKLNCKNPNVIKNGNKIEKFNFN